LRSQGDTTFELLLPVETDLVRCGDEIRKALAAIDDHRWHDV